MPVVLMGIARPGVAVIRLNRPEVRNALTTEIRRLIGTRDLHEGIDSILENRAPAVRGE